MPPLASRYKTRFVATAAPYTPPASERMEALASLDKLRALMPPGVDPATQPALLFVAANLAVGNVVNLNDDAMTLDDTLRTYRGFEWQLVDIEHDRSELRGFIVKAGLSELGTNRLVTEAEARAAGNPVNIAVVIALWKVVDADLCAFIEAMDAPASPDRGKLSLSFEVGFDDYDVVVLPAGASNLALATRIVTPDATDFGRYDRLLRVNGGRGVMGDGARVARIIMGNIIPLGAGIVTVPAAAVKGLTAIVESPHAAATAASTYPYGSKCPTCAAPTMRTQRTTSPDAEEGCANGHTYRRCEAVKVETDAGLYQYSSTQCTLSAGDAEAFVAYAKSIPDDHVYTDPEDETLGRELSPHITALYGILGTDHAQVQACLAGCGPVSVTLGEVSAFTGDDRDYDVLKVDVHSDDLHRIHHLIKTATATETKWPTYSPHLTIGYLKRGMASGYVGDTRFKGRGLTFESIDFSPHTGDRITIPLRMADGAPTDQFGEVHSAAPAQTVAAPVYSEDTMAILPGNPIGAVDTSKATPTRVDLATSSRQIKLSTGWQERLAALQAAAGKDPLVDGVTVTLSDGRVLSNVRIFDGATLELDKELSMYGVVITDMTPGARPQADAQAVETPSKADVYPTTSPEQQARQAAVNAERDVARNAAYTDASLAAIERVLSDPKLTAEVRAQFWAQLGEPQLLPANTAVAGVSPSNPTPPSMDLATLKQSLAAVKTVEELPTAVANVAAFADVIAKASEQMAKDRQAALDATATANTSLATIQTQLAALTTKHNELVAAQQAAAAEAQFNDHMAAVEATFDLDDEVRAEIVEEVKAASTDEAFAKWLASAKKKMKGFIKKGGKDDAACATVVTDAQAVLAAKTALASAAANIVDAPVSSANSTFEATPTLREQMQTTFAGGISIGGVKVKDLAKGAK